MNEFIKEVYARFNVLVGSKNDADSICSKMNAEFQGCFYRNKNDIYCGYLNNGKQDIQKLGTVA